MTSYSVYCSTKKESKEIDVQFPAWEICPVCENFFGIGHGECFFTVRKISDDFPLEIANFSVVG